MLIIVVSAMALVAGVHPVGVAAVALAAISPRWFLLAVAAWAVYSWNERRRAAAGPDDEAALLRALSAELRSGASLRSALAEAAHSVPSLDLAASVRVAAAGMPVDLVADDLVQTLPENGRLVAAAFRLSSWSGARVAAVFDNLASRAAEAADLSRERSAATVQARLSAAIVGLAPLAISLFLFATGRVSIPEGVGVVGAVVVGLGLALEVAGLAIVAVIIRRESR
jgi:Flp pilus assembly protein TadB